MNTQMTTEELKQQINEGARLYNEAVESGQPKLAAMIEREVMKLMKELGNR